MELGIPAVVPPSFPYPYGRQVIAADMDETLSAISAMPNLRVKAVQGRTVDLPEGADPVHARVSFNATRRLGGSDCSFLAC